MTISVTHDDIEDSFDDLENNPISRALLRTTGQLFRVFPAGFVFQMQTPFNTAFLPVLACRNWMHYQQDGVMEPMSFEIDLKLETQHNNFPVRVA